MFLAVVEFKHLLPLPPCSHSCSKPCSMLVSFVWLQCQVGWGIEAEGKEPAGKKKGKVFELAAFLDQVQYSLGSGARRKNSCKPGVEIYNPTIA